MVRRAFGGRVFQPEGTVLLRYRIDLFLDDRMAQRTSFGGLSVDRLGVRKAQDSVLSRLLPLCELSATKRSSKFVGWAQILVSDLRQPVFSTPAENEANGFHAEIDTTPFGNRESIRAFAFELCVAASRNEFIEKGSLEFRE